MAFWNPWRGCHKYSAGCLHCYIHKGDLKRGVNTDLIVKTENFYSPIKKNKNGEYKIKSGTLVYLCFSTDFLLEEADSWRSEIYEMIRIRNDLNFLFLTKRIDRFLVTAPNNYESLDNLFIGCTVEDDETAKYRLEIFKTIKLKHKFIACQPLIGKIDLSNYLEGIEYVLVGGESDKNARPLYYDYVLDIRECCLKNKINFDFRQCGSVFIKDGVTYRLSPFDLTKQAKKANIDLKFYDLPY